MNIYFHTLGCKVNQYETESMREALINLGHTSDKTLPADAVLINSCTVTAESDRKTRQIVRRYRRENPNAVIVLTGCMVQAFPEDAKKLTDADIIIGNRDVSAVVNAITEYTDSRIFEIDKHQTTDTYNTVGISTFNERTRAFMKIEDGCERYCTYCIIPFARGNVRSRAVDDIKREAERLAQNGFCEIVLVGINLSSYGKGENFDLCDAIDAVCSVEKIKRVRLSSLEPDLITDDMLNRMKAQPKFCPQFHLSLQSGCDATLNRMNRRYDTAFYEDLVRRIRNIFEDAAITTDIMVGFAGETQQEFEESLAFVKKIGFARSHIFAYSRRTGTVAAALKSQVSNAEKEKRSHIMAETAKKSENEFLNKLCNKTFSVLFERGDDGVAEGYTKNYSKVIVKTDRKLTGEIHDVIIRSVKDDYCVAELL